MRADHPDNALRLRRHFRAAPDVLFSVFTRPQLVESWFAASHGFRASDCTIDLRPGGSWRLTNRKGDVVETVAGVYHEVVDGRRLCYTYRFLGTEFFSVISLDFSPDDSGTWLDFLQTGFPDEESFREHGFGWGYVLAMLEDALLARHGAGTVWRTSDGRDDVRGVAADIEAARARMADKARGGASDRTPA